MERSQVIKQVGVACALDIFKEVLFEKSNAATRSTNSQQMGSVAPTASSVLVGVTPTPRSSARSVPDLCESC
jgi:hypothetical protein